MDWQKDTFTISTDKSQLNITYIHMYLSERSYWAEKIPLAVVEAAIAGSECFGLFEGGRQIGFARVVTDKATFAYLADVFVDENYRGLGLSKWLMAVIMAHPELQGFRTWMLATRDAHGLYEQFGFKLADPDKIMWVRNPGIYKNRQ